MAIHVRAEEGATSPSGGYHRILVPLIGEDPTRAVAIACRVAAERHATITALAVIAIPVQLPLSAHMPDEEAQAKSLVRAADAVASGYGVDVVQRIVRARTAGEAIVAAASRDDVEVIVMEAPPRPRWRRRPLDDTVQFVLKHTPSRVVLDAGPAGA